MKTFLSTMFCALIALNGFSQWQSLPSVNTNQLVIHAVSRDTVHVAGYSGVFLRSTDGGNSFTRDSLDLLGGWMLDMQFTSNQVGYACGGTAFGLYSSPIVKTIDGGLTWDTLITNRFGYELTSLHFVSEQLGFFGGHGFIVSTSDGGSTFRVDTVGVSSVNDIHFFNALEGVVVGGQKLLHTSDGGQSWDTTLVDTTLPNAWSGGRIQFPNNGNIGFYLNSENHLYKTIDGGLNWNNLGQITDSLQMADVQFTSASVGFVGMSHPLFFHNRGFVLATIDGGLTWSEVARSDTGGFNQISMVDDKIGYAATYQRLYRTDNGAGLSMVNGKLKPFELYPNPASQSVYIDSEELDLKGIKLLSLDGAVVKVFEPTKRHLMLDGIVPGVYILQLQESNGFGTSKRLVIQ